MAVNVAYSFQLLQSFEFTTGSVVRDVDVVGLANGGFAVAGENSSSFSSVEIYNGNLALAGSVGAISLRDPAIAQLTNGNLAIAQVNGFDAGVLVIVDQAGNVVVNGQVFADFDKANAVDIAALTGGGFVVAHSGLDSSAGEFVAVKIFNNAGTELLDISVTGAVIVDEPVVAALDDGGFALAYRIAGAADNAIWMAVYNANGSVRSAPRRIDFAPILNSFGALAMTAMDGGFALAYEDRSVSANSDIRLTLFNSNGGQIDTGTLTGPATIDETPSLARMPGGLLAVSLGYSTVGPADSDTFLGLYDPVTETFLAQRVATMGNPMTDDTDDAVIASFGTGRLAAFHTNRTDNDVDGEALEVVRTSTGDAGGDLFDASEYRDVQNGGGGSDFLDGGGNNDTLNGEAGDDNMVGGAGNDTLNGGAGIDTAFYTGTAAVTVNLSLTTAQNTGGAGIDTLSGIENLIGSQAGDTLTGNSGNNRIDGGGGNDTMAGGLGLDTYVVDSLGDVVNEAANAGEDTIQTGIANYSLFFIANVERLTYTGITDFVGRGNATNNRIQGGDFNDRFVVDQGGADTFLGDTGIFDQMDFRPGAVGAIVNLTTGVHAGAAAGDTFSSIEAFYGSDTAGDNFTGAAFNDRLDGYGGNDTLVGLGGNDTLMGGNGDDEISGGALLDFLYGNAGADDFNYTALSDSGPTSGARDRIYDFQAGSDDIDVFAIDARASSTGNNAFTQFIGAAAFTAEGQVRWYQSGVNTVIEFNTTGTSGAEIQIQLQNFTAANLAAGDFIP